MEAVCCLAFITIEVRLGMGTGGGFPFSGGLKGLLLPGGNIASWRRFCDVAGNDKKSV